ncbi:MAG: NAD-dependent dehydratase, partial [Bacteroidetes bacterium]|nr:NAD-dependent dehydratase [Bacteroidota bacterium]
AEVPAGVTVLRGDASSVDSARDVTRDAAVVYQCAQPAYHQWPEKFPPLQHAVLQAAASQGAKLVLAENLYGYGEVEGAMHESLPFRATTRKGRVRARMSEAALEAHRTGRLRVAIGRGSDFFGPGVRASALGDRVFLPALAGKTPRLGGALDLPHSFTYIDDFGEALAVLGEHDEADGQAWHVPNDRPSITQRELMNIVFEEIGLPPRMAGTSRMMMRLAGIFIAGARETVEMMYEFEKPFVVDSSKFERTFGMKATPIHEALRATIDWYNLKGLR